MTARYPNLSTVATTLGMLVALGALTSWQAYAQQPQPSGLTVGGHRITGIPDDWTHHHIVFSNPGSEQEAIRNGTHARWLTIVNDPRYIIQQLQRGQPAQGPSAAAVAQIEGPAASPVPAQIPQPSAPTPGTFAAARANANTGAHPVPLSGTSATLAINPSPGSPSLFRPARRRLRKDWSMDLGAGAMGLTTFPAKYSFTTASASCTNDFVVFSTGILGTASQATITAYKNLYAACGGTVPSAAWQYNTAGDSFLSPVLSLDGTQVAYVQYVCTANCGESGEVDESSLVVLKWKANPSLVTLSSTAPASYRACAAPCMTALTFANSGYSGFSSPFYDYANDVIYIGDDTGVLHQFTGIFHGTPAENTTSPWPVTLGSTALSQPVLDHVSGLIFVGDTGGFYYAVNASTGAITGTSAQLDYVYGLWDAPLVDSSAQMTYVFAGNDGQTDCYDEYSGEYGCSGVFQFPTTFTNLANTESQVYVGYYPLFTGAFDNIYMTSSASSPTGHLYVCGETDYDFVQTLNQIPITSNAMGGQSVSSYYLGDGYPCSAVTEFYNSAAAADYIFLSVEGAYQGCTQDTGCVFGFNVTSGAVPTAPTAGTAEAGGTSAIVIDNAGAASGASQIYFTTLSKTGTCATSGGTGLCAVQTSQSAP
jgi:hypothetical protein